MKRKVLACLLTAILLVSEGQAVMARNVTDIEPTESVELMTEEEKELTTEDTETADTEMSDDKTVDTETVNTETEDTETINTETEDTETVNTETADTETVSPETTDTETEETETFKASHMMADEILDEDPQAGISMSNEEPENLSDLKRASSTYNGYTGSTYVHSGRFDSGYRIVNGIDVSKHNGNIDWAAVRAAGVEYAMIRVAYRGLSNGALYDDPMYQANIQGALNAGIKVGVYVFSQATTQAEAIEEANYVLSRIGGYNITLPVVIDYEYGVNHTGRLAAANLNIDTMTAIVNAFCSTVQSAGHTPMLYANKTMLESSIRGDILDDYYKIWLANYTTQTTYVGEYYAWQYSSRGFVNGISGYVDCNFFYERENMQNAQLYVNRLYQNLLGRDVDAPGINGYARAISDGRMTPAQVASEIVNGGEFKLKKYSNSECAQRLYQAILVREPGASELSNWTEVLNNGVSPMYVLKQLVESPEFATICTYYMFTPGTVTLTENRDLNYNATAYVMRCYRKILGRDADVTGLNTWTGKLRNGNGGAEIVKDLVVSEEFRNMRKSDGEFIDILYAAMLDRNSDEAGKNDWLRTLNDGVSYVYIINGFSGSVEFGNICSSYGIVPGQAEITEARDRNLKVTQYVNRCYEKALGREGETGGINDWCSIILSKTQSPKDVALGFVFSPESINQGRSNADYVEMLYNLCLGRASDEAGKADWVNRLEQGTSRETVYWGFANSTEFENIIASYGL